MIPFEIKFLVEERKCWSWAALVKLEKESVMLYFFLEERLQRTQLTYQNIKNVVCSTNSFKNITI